MKPKALNKSLTTIKKTMISSPMQFEHVGHADGDDDLENPETQSKLFSLIIRPSPSLNQIPKYNGTKAAIREKHKSEAELFVDSVIMTEAPSLSSLAPMSPDGATTTMLPFSDTLETTLVVITAKSPSDPTVKLHSSMISTPLNFQHLGHAEDVIEAQHVMELATPIRKKRTRIRFNQSATQLLHDIFNSQKKKADKRLELIDRLTMVKSPSARKLVKEEWLLKEQDEIVKKQRAKSCINDFEVLQTLGHGGFGVVRLVKDKDTKEVYAMKSIRKKETIVRKQEGNVRAERDLLSLASQVAEWIVKLLCTFQDDDNLYFVMDYMPGGDLLGLLIKLDIFPDDFAIHYCAEMVLAIEEVHKLGMIHRDIKPDNFLIDQSGHIKLADFGLATNLLSAKLSSAFSVGSDRNEQQTRKQAAYSIVGTANYIAPEVLMGGGYDKSCDWWSLGVIIYECVFGYPPFSSKSQSQVKQNVLNWKKTLLYPQLVDVSITCKHLISRLLCHADDRFGSKKIQLMAPKEGLDAPAMLVKQMIEEGDAADIKAHAWFKDVNWEKLHVTRAPFVPDPQSCYFDAVDEEEVNNLHMIDPEDEVPDMLELVKQKKEAFKGFSFQAPNAMGPKNIL